MVARRRSDRRVRQGLVSLTGLALFAAASSNAQPTTGAAASEALSFERVFLSADFKLAEVPELHWTGDGESYLYHRLVEGGGSEVVRVAAASGEESVLVAAAELLVDGKRLEITDLKLAPDGSRLLLFHSPQQLVPHKTGGVYHLFDLDSRSLRPLSTGPGLQLLAKFSPDGRQVAFVRDNDLFLADLGADGGERRLTFDGSRSVLNGLSDWVYDEELDLEDAYRFSPDGRRIAYWRFDQTRVSTYAMVDFLELYPKVEPLPYPKAGEPNAVVKIGSLDLESGRTSWIDVGDDDGYVARLEWLDAERLVMQQLPRSQQRVDLLVADATSGKTTLLLSDGDPAYVNVLEQPVWIDDGRRFLWLSDRSGWRQLFLYAADGRLLRQVTSDDSDVLDVAGVDEGRGEVYVTVAAPDPTQQHVFRYRLAGGTGERVTVAPGSHALELAPGARYAVVTHSRLGTPPSRRLYQLPEMRELRVLGDNAVVHERMQAADLAEPEFFRLPLPNGTELDAYRLLPPAFDHAKPHPVLMYVYGGPAAPTVKDQWNDQRYFFHQLLVQRGYVVVSVDNRGAAWRGREFRKITQYRMGLIESQDQIDAARWLAAQPWVDARRIGIWGRSYGGFMTALATMRGGDVFKVGLSIVPVTDWRLYDTIYTERFMSTPAANPDGYRDTAPLNLVEGLTAELLLVTTTGDDNVHPQNALQLAHRLAEAGKRFSMMVYLNRPHGLSGGNTRAHWYDAMLDFVLDKL